MSVVTRSCKNTELDAWKDFLDRCFGYEAPMSYTTDFAPLFEGQALERSRLIWNGPQILSSGTLSPTGVITPAGKFTVGIVGAIATDPAARRLGFSSAILQDLEIEARLLGLQGLVLWSDQLEFYEKHGFKPAGQQEIYSLAPLARTSGVLPQYRERFEQVLKGGTAAYGWDLPKIKAMYEAHPFRCFRSPSYWEAITKVTSCTRLQWISDKGDVKAYIAYGRGKDLAGIIHEWGGDPVSLVALVATVLKEHPDLLWLTNPNLPDPIVEACGLVGTDSNPIMSTHLALFKPFTEILPLSSLWFWGLDSL